MYTTRLIIRPHPTFRTFTLRYLEIILPTCECFILDRGRKKSLSLFEFPKEGNLLEIQPKFELISISMSPSSLRLVVFLFAACLYYYYYPLSVFQNQMSP